MKKVLISVAVAACALGAYGQTADYTIREVRDPIQLMNALNADMTATDARLDVAGGNGIVASNSWTQLGVIGIVASNGITKATTNYNQLGVIGIVASNSWTQLGVVGIVASNGITQAVSNYNQLGVIGVVASNSWTQLGVIGIVASNGITEATSNAAQLGVIGIVASNAWDQVGVIGIVASNAVPLETVTMGISTNAGAGTVSITNSVAGARYLYVWTSATAGGAGDGTDLTSITATTGAILAGGGATVPIAIVSTDVTGKAVVVVTVSVDHDRYLNVLTDNRTIVSSPLMPLDVP